MDFKNEAGVVSRPHVLNVSRYTKERKKKMLFFGSFSPKKTLATRT